MIENYLNKRYEFTYNEILNRIFYKHTETDNEFKLLKSYRLNSIKRELNNNNIKVTLSDLKSLLESDFVKKQNPFKDYFFKLPKWDGKRDQIAELLKTIHTTAEQDFQWAFKKWLVAMVACALDEGVTNQTILILAGKQGLGKTTWLHKLVPEPLKEYFFSGQINPANKDTTLLMSEKLIINLDELASLTKKQIEGFKEMITKNIITERRAYAHFTENYIRRASFVGSSNHNEILMDVTGNRRFLCFEATTIDFEHEINMELVYSQVMYLLDNDFECHFNKEDIARLEENNKMFIQSSEEVDCIDDLFELPNNANKHELMNATEIMHYVKNRKSIRDRIDVQTIGKIMTSKDYPRKKVNGSWKYIVSKKNG